MNTAWTVTIMNKLIALATLVMLTATSTQLAFAGSYDEKADLAANLEETLGHFRALELNLDAGNASLALTHATHPVAELYDVMRPVLRAADPELDARVQATLVELKDKATTDVPRAQAQQAIDDAKQAVEAARAAIVGDRLSNDPEFKLNLMRGLLETSVAEYGEAVTGGAITEMAEFQDGSAFVWRSQQIFDTVSGDLDPGDATEIASYYDQVWASYGSLADPSAVEAQVGGILSKIDQIAGDDGTGDDLLAYVENIRTLLADAKQAYGDGDGDLALSLATRAYLDNYEFLEAPLIDLGKEDLMAEVEIMMREDLRNMIKSGAAPSAVNAQIDAILAKMDTIATIVPEFGTIAMTVLAVAITSLIAVSAKSRLGTRA